MAFVRRQYADAVLALYRRAIVLSAPFMMRGQGNGIDRLIAWAQLDCRFMGAKMQLELIEGSNRSYLGQRRSLGSVASVS